MKKLISILMALMMLMGACFAEEIVLTLPEGMEMLDGKTLEGYEKAVQSDFPDAAETILAAVSEDGAMAVTVSAVESELDGPAAAKEAAEKILGSSDSVAEAEYAGIACGSFACAVGDLQFDLYYLAGNGRLLIVGTSGIEKAAVEEMLNSISF